MAHKATLTIDGKTVELPVIEGTEGELAVDITQLRAQTGVITFDPGYGENARVVEWILSRCRGEGKAVRTPIGHIPAPDALDLNGLDLPGGSLEKLLEVRNDEWRAEAADHKVFLDSLGPKLPEELRRQNEELGERLSPDAVGPQAQ